MLSSSDLSLKKNQFFAIKIVLAHLAYKPEDNEDGTKKTAPNTSVAHGVYDIHCMSHTQTSLFKIFKFGNCKKMCACSYKSLI